MGGDQQAEAGGVDEGDVLEVEHEPARTVREHAVEHRLQGEGGGHVEVAGEVELDAVVAGRLVDGEVGHRRRAFPLRAGSNPDP